jgi:hypothetical protein
MSCFPLLGIIYGPAITKYVVAKARCNTTISNIACSRRYVLWYREKKTLARTLEARSSIAEVRELS